MPAHDLFAFVEQPCTMATLTPPPIPSTIPPIHHQCISHVKTTQEALEAAGIPPTATWAQAQEHYALQYTSGSTLDALTDADRRQVFIEFQTEQRKEAAFRGVLASAVPAVQVCCFDKGEGRPGF